MLYTIFTWLFVDTIFGAIAITAVFTGLALALQGLLPNVVNPGVVAALTFVLCIATFPSVPRYEFERDTFAQIQGVPHMRVIAKTKWGAITEPLTWFWAPVGHVYAVSPTWDGEFREVLFRYDEEVSVALVEQECEDRSLWRAMPGRGGVFRYVTERPTPMTEEEYEVFCVSDWTPERTALLKAIREEGGQPEVSE